MLRSCSNKHGVIFGRQIPKGDILADLHVFPEFYAGVQKHLLIGVAVLAVQAERRNAVAQHTAHAGIGIKHSHLRTTLVQPDGGGNAGGTGAHYGHAVIGMLQGMTLQSMLKEVLGRYLMLNLMPADGRVFHVEDAMSQAELLPVAHQGGDGAQGVVPEQHCSGFLQAALTVKRHALRNGCMNRAALKGAFWLFAKQAT